MAGLSGRTGWGFLSSQIAVTQVVGGVSNVVLNNVGAALSIIAGAGALRLTKIAWRVDLAPDVAVGTVVVPVLWRVIVFSGSLPPDITALQLQAFPNGAHPEIPAKIGIGAPVPILHDLWLDFSAGDEGLNKLAERDFADGGPSVNALETMNVAVFPLQDANLSNAPLGVANVIISLGAWGTGVTVNPQGGNGALDGGSKSLPRYGVSIDGWLSN
jgi:hypothetical protein